MNFTTLLSPLRREKSSAQVPHAALLEQHIRGAVIWPGDPEYDPARQAWNRSVDQYPAVIVAACDTEDVVQAVRWAREEGLEIAVQATGHGNKRPANGALLLLTSSMREVQINAVAQVATVEAGVKWGSVLAAAQAVSLAPLVGSSPDVGVVGYTLGGGMGWLARKYGLATDSVLWIELVTAAGDCIRASEADHPDLFWGLRGSGGSLGIVTRMAFRLYPVTTVYAGNLIYPLAAGREVMAHYRAWLADAPDELTSSIVIMNFPPHAEVPEPLRGQSFVMVRGCYCGSIIEGERLLQHWRTWQAPAMDDWRAIAFADMATISNDPVDPMPALSTSVSLRELSDEVIDILLRYGAAANGSPFVFSELRHAGGAMTAGNAIGSAYGNRTATFILQHVGVIPTPAAAQRLAGYAAEIKQALQPVLAETVYMNFLEGEEAQRNVRRGFTPEIYRRLTALKSQYDPANVIGFGFNIAPGRQEEATGN